MKEEEKYLMIKKLVDTNGNKKRAAVKLQCSTRHINRMIQGYKQEGKEYFVHGNRDRQPIHTIPDETKSKIIKLYETVYDGANFTHFTELLAKNDKIHLSSSAIRSMLMKEHILSPRATRRVRKQVREELKQLDAKALANEETAVLTPNTVPDEDAHPRRPRCKYFGEMLQMDASLHVWFGKDKTQLHIAVDDSTGQIVGAYFDHQETLNGYYHLLYQILTTYGIPAMFFTDRRTVFEYKQIKNPATEDDTFTQFSYACSQLGIDIKTSSVPQAKGRVERYFQTLQSRLTLELKLAGIDTIDQANIFLNSYIKEYNDRFAIPIKHSKSVFEKQPQPEKINQILAVITDRKIDSGHCIRFDKKYFRLVDSNSHPVYYYKGTECLVIHAFDGQLFASVGETLHALEEVPQHANVSKEFDFPVEEIKQRKIHIPPMEHPWKKKSFEAFQRKQAHKDQKTA